MRNSAFWSEWDWARIVISRKWVALWHLGSFPSACQASRRQPPSVPGQIVLVSLLTTQAGSNCLLLALIQSSPWLRSTGDPSTADRGLTYNWRQSKQSGYWLSPPPSPAVKSMYRKHLNRRGLEYALAVDCCIRSIRSPWVTNSG